MDEPGYSREEIERGEDKPGCTATRNPAGCLIMAAVVAASLYGLWRLMF